jgi:signal recognition particle receptor subunit beta
MKRLVLYGPPLAGKTTILKAIAAAHSASIETFYAHSRDDDRLICRGTRTELTHSSSTIELATLGGPKQDHEIWRALLDGAAAVVLVLDGQREREEANRTWVANLASGQTLVPGCVVITKLDLRNATFAPAQLVSGTRFATWPTARSSAGDATSAALAVEALFLGL